MKNVIFQDLGLIEYKKCWDYQEVLFNATISRKISNRKNSNYKEVPTNDYLIFCEHPHVYTLGKSGDSKNILLNQTEMASRGLDYFKINRGGDITYHGPGQIVGYPILDLDHFFTDIGLYLRTLEEAIILTLADYGLKGGRVKGATGVWLDIKDPKKARKICAIGVRTSRWVTMHGFAFNVNTNLEYFNNIIPCGIEDKEVTSLEKELGEEQNISEVKNKLKCHFSDLFQINLEQQTSQELLERSIK